MTKRRSQKVNQATPSLSHCPVKAPDPVRTHCTNAWWNRNDDDDDTLAATIITVVSDFLCQSLKLHFLELLLITAKFAFCIRRWYGLLHAGWRGASWLAEACTGWATIGRWPGIPRCHSSLLIVFATESAVLFLCEAEPLGSELWPIAWVGDVRFN